MKKASSRPRDKQPTLTPRYWTGAHTTHRLRYHVVLVPKYRKRVPKYRKRVLKGEVAVRLEALIRQACAVNGWEPEELAVQPDHAHLLVAGPAALQCGADYVDAQGRHEPGAKGGVPRPGRVSVCPRGHYFVWGESFWADGYFAATVGVVEGSVVTAYIQNQRA